MLGLSDESNEFAVVDQPAAAAEGEGVLEPWPITGLFQLNRAELGFAVQQAPELRGMLWVAVPVAALSVMTGFVAGYFGLHTGLLHLFGLYVLCETWWLVARLGQGVSRLQDVTQRVTLTSEQVRLELAGGAIDAPSHQTLCFRWELLAGYYRGAGCFVLFDPKRQPLVIPTILFSPEQIDAISERLYRSMPRGRHGSWVRIAMVAALLLGGWLVWEVPIVREWVGG